jgi:hypothetical protein
VTPKQLRSDLFHFPDDARVTLDYVPEVFEFSGAPRNPSRLYILVDELPELMHEDDENALIERGWVKEQEGECWLLYL